MVLVHRSIALGVDLPSLPYPLAQIPLIFDKFLNFIFGSLSQTNLGEHLGEHVLSPKIPARIPATPKSQPEFPAPAPVRRLFCRNTIRHQILTVFLFVFCSCFACVSQLTSSFRNICTYALFDTARPEHLPQHWSQVINNTKGITCTTLV